MSLRPTLISGIPVRKAFIVILPFTSQRSTVPLLFISTFTCSRMSKNTCAAPRYLSTPRAATTLSVGPTGGFSTRLRALLWAQRMAQPRALADSFVQDAGPTYKPQIHCPKLQCCTKKFIISEQPDECEAS